MQIAQGDLQVLFRQFSSADAARQGLMDVLPNLTQIYGDSVASLAADWYDEVRATAGARGRFTPVLGDLPPRGQTDALARWGIAPLFQPQPDFTTAYIKVSGGLQRLIANVDRQTIRLSSLDDSRAQGWVRVGTGECDWCQQYLDGEVHYTEGYDFDAHDHCQCIAEPVFD